MTTAKRIDEAKLKADLEKLGGFRFEKLSYEEEDFYILVMLTVRFFGETVGALQTVSKLQARDAAFDIWAYVSEALLFELEKCCSDAKHWPKRIHLRNNLAAFRKIDRALTEIAWPEHVEIVEENELGRAFGIRLQTVFKRQVLRMWISCDKSVREENCADALKNFQTSVTRWLSALQAGVLT